MITHYSWTIPVRSEKTMRGHIFLCLHTTLSLLRFALDSTNDVNCYDYVDVIGLDTRSAVSHVGWAVLGPFFAKLPSPVVYSHHPAAPPPADLTENVQ